MALNYILQNNFRPNVGLREDARKIGVLVTEGKSQDEIVVRSQNLRDSGIELYAIGVKNADENELRSIASDPDEIHMYNVNDFQFLLDIVDDLSDNLCNSVKAPGAEAEGPEPPTDLITSEVMTMMEGSNQTATLKLLQVRLKGKRYNTEVTVENWRPRGRPERRFMDVVTEDMKLVGVREEEAEERYRWCRGFTVDSSEGNRPEGEEEERKTLWLNGFSYIISVKDGPRGGTLLGRDRSKRDSGSEVRSRHSAESGTHCREPQTVPMRPRGRPRPHPHNERLL